MTSDDERVEYLAGGQRAGDAGAGDGGAGDDELDDLRDLLADRALWAEPSAELEDAVVAAIAAEAAAAPAVPAVNAGTAARVRPGRLRLVVAGAAAAAVAAVAVGVGVASQSASDDPDLVVALAPADLVPGASGSADLTRTTSGWRIELSAAGLPRLDGTDELYQAWLKDDAGHLVPVGTFNEGDDVVLWAGVSPRAYPTLTITREDVGGDPGSSGQRVLVGPVTRP